MVLLLAHMITLQLIIRKKRREERPFELSLITCQDTAYFVSFTIRHFLLQRQRLCLQAQIAFTLDSQLHRLASYAAIFLIGKQLGRA